MSEDEFYIVLGVDVPEREVLRMAESHSHQLIYVVVDTMPTSVESPDLHEILASKLRAYATELVASLPIEEDRIFNPYLQKHFRGPIRRSTLLINLPRLNLKVKCGSRDRKVNKRKNYLKSLRA
jgi:hypothetical protein